MQELIATQAFHGYRFRGTRYDCGDKVGFLLANLAFGLVRPDMSEKLRAGLRNLV